MLVSGINGVDVETVWDERHKNLYVIFKDIVTEDNNEALMFHEPSNRWICFTNMDQTPVNGWTQMIELEWSVLRGFDGGIGYKFDEDTRFAVFNIVTPHDETALMLKQDLAMTLFAPTIVIDCTVTADLLTLSGALPGPTITTPFISALPALLQWTAEEYGSGSEKTITIDCSPIGGYYVYSLSYNLSTGDSVPQVGLDSLYFYDKANGQQINAGSSTTGTAVYDGMVIGVYPQLPHTGGVVTAFALILATAGGSVSSGVQLSRLAATGNPTVRVQASGGAGNSIIFATNAGTAISGSTSAAISVMATHVDGLASFNIFVTASLTRAGVTISAPTFTIVVVGGIGADAFSYTTGLTQAVTLTLSQQILSGDILDVYLYAYGSGSEPTATTASAALNSLALSLPAPTVVITVVSPDTIGLQWADNDTSTQNFSIDTGDAVQTRVSYAPSWITILDSGGNDLKGGHYIIDEEVCTMNPTNVNLGGQLDDDVTFVNEMGDTNTIHVRHLAKAGVTPITLSISGSDTTDLAFMTGVGREATLTNGTELIALRATFDSPLYGQGGYYTVYWYATKGGIFAGRGNFPYWDEQEVNVQLVLNAPASTSDTIIIYFAGNYI